MNKRWVKMSSMRGREERAAWLFILPVALGILVFQVYPVLFSLYVSFTRWDLLTSPSWVGLHNYVELFTTDRFFFQVLSNTALYAMGTILPGMALALVFSSLLNQKIIGQAAFRAIYFVPVVIPTAAVALLWRWIYEPNFGIINVALRLVGIQGPMWINTTHTALLAVIIEAVWAGLGLNIVIYLAGLQSISKEYYEAAEMDGASALQKFTHITLPLISPISFFLLVTGIINAFQVFDVPFVMTSGGPANATQMIVMYLYANAFKLQRMGSAAAIGYIVFMLILLVTFINFRMEKRWVFYEEAV
jgi:multiple sugar transport system permease protein